MNKIIQGDCVIELKTLEENSIDSIVTDPPYELGFMGKSWDNTGIANNPEMWKECLRVLKPGGYLLSFGGTRTYHRMACAIEDAGFEVRDMIEWVYGSGFPKSLNIGKAVDKLQGNERKEFKRTDGAGTSISGKKTIYGSGVNKSENATSEFIDTKGTSEWEGWGTALKPAHEPICMARKPLSEKTVAENVLKYGTGGINIDESRVGLQEGEKKVGGFGNEKIGFQDQSTDLKRNVEWKESTQARFPANLIHDNSEEVRECFPESKGGAFPKTHGSSGFVSPEEKENRVEMNDSGNASRFFKSIIYQAKASKSERNKGCEELEDKLGGSLEGGNDKRNGENKPQLKTTKNNHPTVKPIALMEYLIKMVTPKGGTVLDPFAGSGSTLVAAKQSGFQYIGIEMTEEYIPIIQARLNSIK